MNIFLFPSIKACLSSCPLYRKSVRVTWCFRCCQSGIRTTNHNAVCEQNPKARHWNIKCLLCCWPQLSQCGKSYMEVGDVLSVQRFGDRQLAWDRVDDEDAGRRLVGPGARHAVTQHPVLIPVWADLKQRKNYYTQKKTGLEEQLLW